jgi:hypothetical protein
MKNYKVVGDMSFDENTPDKVCNVLVNLNQSRERVRIYLGENGKAWNEDYDVCGVIGKSTGAVKIPLMINNKRSSGGGALLDQYIMKIVRTSDGKVLYQHPEFNCSTFTNVGCELFADGEHWGKNHSEESAKRFCDFMNGKRFSK